MNRLKVKDALSPRYAVALPEERISAIKNQLLEKNATHCAVLDHTSTYLGLIRLQDILLSNTQRIFADLLRPSPYPPLSADAPLVSIMELIRQETVDALPVLNSVGGFIGIVTHRSFLTALLQTQEVRLANSERDLQQSEERLRLVSVATSDAIWDWNPVTSEVWTTEESLANDAERMVKTDLAWWKKRLHPEDEERVIANLLRAINGKETRWQSEFRYRRDDGSYAVTLGRACIIRDLKGVAARVVGAMTDLTERTNLEAQLRQAQKMETIGQLAGGIAHDFNNLVMVILGNMELLQANDEFSQSSHRQLEAVTNAAKRAAKLVEQLLTFGRKRVMEPVVVDLSKLTERTANLLRSTLGEDVCLELNLSEAPVLVYADEVMLEQVLVNLAVNARDAMPKGGVLIITTQTEVVERQPQDSVTSKQPGHYAKLMVSDTGCGIPAHVLPRIFEPFFTTKGPERGTGLGLSTVYGIIRQHEGYIDVQSAENQGTTVSVYFPLPKRETLSSKTTAQVTEMPKGTEMVLLVEDERGVREVVRTCLERLGYRVVEADSGQQALNQWENHKSEIQLLLTDIVMPGGMTGIDLARYLQERHAGLKVLCMSGYRPESLGLGAIADLPFISKPFQVRDLAQAVKKSLSAN